jgi:isoleucyl-tRNA synthetase
MTTDYKSTLNLPQTGFPMKAGLVEREPLRLLQWENRQLYRQIQARRAGAQRFVLHDGPPFANGDVHIGTALNKILKDIIIKFKTLRGFSAPYIPGWDCHGLPIEFKVSQEMRKAGDTSAGAATIRKACETYARKYIDLQRAQFKRLGVLGDWENPYLTLNKEYEADELRLFADIVEKGFVYRGKKPVYWSIPCRTALAEAEVEYADHVSQSVFVKFPVVGREKTFIVIWTTTPWTLPANLAVAYNEKLQYVQVKVGEENYILFRGLFRAVAEKCGWKEDTETPFPTEQLAAIQYQHPFCNRIGRLFPAEFVTSDTGTGFVHIAPGHGLDDYNLGRRNGLPIYSPVNDDGALAYSNELPLQEQMPAEMAGKSILEKHGKSDANEAVLHALRLRHALLHQENYHHSYPHCWRSKTPVIFRAMDQWFIQIDHEKFRQRALGEIDRVQWIPDWGVNRIKSAVQTRPDWCISRQRTWGVPIPAFYDAKGEPILDAQIVRNTADLIGRHGSNIWFEKSAGELWALVKPKDWNGAQATSKSNDTLDVWIDSGSSSRAVIARRAEIRGQETPFQADMYLEGSDQHRGWFQSSLLLSLAGNGAAPFKTVLTHGFVVDADREKISKSKQGAYEKPQTAEAYVNKYGADVVRLWVASQDYRNDIVVSEERINKVGETYRAIRNALRYQLSNLYDFDPTQHTVAEDKLTGLDRWVLDEFSKLEAEVLAAYEKNEFHVVYQKASQFVAVELSAIYHDVIKDRLYTDPANSPRRRSTQTALHRLVTGLCQMLAPILVFTVDEAWEFVPGKKENSIHETNWQAATFSISEAEQMSWRNSFGIRQWLLPKLEEQRRQGTIGKSLDASVIIRLPETDMVQAIKRSENAGAVPVIEIEIAAGVFVKIELSDIFKSEIKELLNVSQFDIHTIPAEPLLKMPPAIADVNEYSFVRKAEGKKCERCWHWETDVGAQPEHPLLCGRCVAAIREAVK